MTDIDASPETIQRLVELVTEHSLTEIEVEHDGVSIRVKGLTSAVAVVPAAMDAAVAAAPVQSAASAASTAAAARARSRAHLLPVLSPMVGTFYRRPSPTDPTYVEIGDRITVGQTIGKIEAMKVFSDVPSEVAGKVVEIAAQDAHLVQLGQPLLYVEP